jgi:polygalacturonase
VKAQLHAEGGRVAETDEAKLDTARLQAALDGCAAGKAVELAADGPNNAFLSGPIELRPGVVLLVDRGVTLFGSRDPRLYAVSPGSCGLVNNEPRGCNPLIHAKGAKGAGIMGDGVIDGRGGAFILGLNHKTWWDLANDARSGGRQQVPRLIEIEDSDDFTLYRITVRNSANFHIVYSHGDGCTVWGLKIDTPKNARNTDGFDPSASRNITVTQSYIRDGDDNIAIKGGNGPVTNMTIIHNHFFHGHGMSIGSETNAGVSRILVRDLSLDGTEAGIRIKSNATRGGLVDGVQYDDVCIRGSNHPIQLDTNYSYAGTRIDSFPIFQNTLLHNVRISASKTISLNGYDHTHRIGVQFSGVSLDSPASYKFEIKHADITIGPGPVNFTIPGGEDSTVRGKATTGTLDSCADKFVEFPVTP